MVWLFVLAPFFLRGQRRIRKAGEAFEDTRVVYEGGSSEMPARRRPRLRPSDVRRGGEDPENAQDYELVDADPDDLADVFIDDREEIVDGDIVHELEPVAAADSGDAVRLSVREDGSLEEAEEAEEAPDGGHSAEEESGEEGRYRYDDGYVAPADLMYPDPQERITHLPVGREVEWIAPDEDEEDTLVRALHSDDDLSEDEIEFAGRRRGRGGWDPVADAEKSLSRYQRRQRGLLALAAAVVISAAIGIVVGGWAWAVPAVAVLVTVIYLITLRNQVRQEQALRARRIRQLRRARLGVRNTESSGLPAPRQLRRPGALVLELDDESPDFEYLSKISSPFRDEQQDGHHGDVIELDDRRRAG